MPKILHWKKRQNNGDCMGPYLLGVKWIWTFYNNFIFSHYPNCLVNPWISEKSIPLNSENP